MENDLNWSSKTKNQLLTNISNYCMHFSSHTISIRAGRSAAEPEAEWPETLYSSVGPSVHRSVGPYVRPSVTHEFKPCTVFDQNYYQYQRECILWPCIRPCSINKFILQMHIMTFCKFYHQYFTDPSCDFMPTHIQLGI